MRHRLTAILAAAFLLVLTVGCGDAPKPTAPTLAGPPAPPGGPGPKVASPQPPGPKGMD